MSEPDDFYEPLDNIEDIDDFEAAVKRQNFTYSLSKEHPYTYWTLELYDQENGIRGGGGLGVLAADTRRIAEQNDVPFVLLTPFYPEESHQLMRDGKIIDTHNQVDYTSFGFHFVDSINIHCNGTSCKLDIIEKKFKNTRIVSVTEPNFGELYADTSGSDHRLYQEVSLGFGGYVALKRLGFKPAIMQLNEVATFFAALARLDELVSNGMDFYEAMVYTRKHTLYTNHTLVQAAEAEFRREQFERFVYPNLRTKPVKKWLDDKFNDGGTLKLSSVTIEIAELRSGVSKLHAKVADYRDIAGNKVKFRSITNGIDMKKWVMPALLAFYQENGILDESLMPTENYEDALETLDAAKIRAFKLAGRELLNETLASRPDQNGQILEFKPDDFIFDFKRRFVDYKRPDMPFADPKRLREILEPRNAHYILTGRIHTGDYKMMKKLDEILKIIKKDSYLNTHVHYIADYDEKLAFALSVGSNVAINLPIIGLEACGTSWMKDVANLNLLISTHDGGVADIANSYHLDVRDDGDDDYEDEVDMLYHQMLAAINIWDNDFDLEYMIRLQLSGYLPIISGTRMLKEYLDYLFSK